MKNIKIKTYSLKKNMASTTNSGHTSIYNPSIANNYYTPSLNTDRKKESNFVEKPISSNGLSDLDKIIKSPSLNISSKLDSKGNRLININFFDKYVRNNIESKSKDKDTNIKENYRESKKQDTEREKNINIKLNINSEVINNIKFNSGTGNVNKDESSLTSNTNTNTHTNIIHDINVNYHLNII